MAIWDQPGLFGGGSGADCWGQASTPLQPDRMGWQPGDYFSGIVRYLCHKPTGPAAGLELNRPV